MAVTITPPAVAAAVGCEEATATRLLPVAVAKIAEYLKGGEPLAGVENESAILYIGYLSQAEASGSGAVVDTNVGPVSSRHITDHSAAFRRCGAAALLTSSRMRRGGII